MEEVEELLIDIVKEKYIAKEILDIYYDFEIQEKYSLVMLELELTVYHEVEDCVYNEQHSRRIHFHEHGTHQVEYEIHHPRGLFYPDLYLIIRVKNTDYNNNLISDGFNISFFDFERILY